MKFAGSKAMKAMDEYTIQQYGIPSDTLMLRAAEGVAWEAKAMLCFTKQKTVVFCGNGNNGGDGIAAAMYLMDSGYEVACVMVGSREKMTNDAQAMEKLLNEKGGILQDYDPVKLPEIFQGCGLIVDALFGTGLDREITGKYAVLIETINNSGIPVLSCDMPSGISADDGRILGCAVKATTTVTFNLPKTGQLLPPGTEYTGQLMIHDIGIPAEARNGIVFDGEYVTENMVRSMLPRDRLESHKGDYGKLLMLCGSVGFTGAAAMASRAALRTGAGLVHLGTPKAVYPILAAKLDEPMVFPLADNEKGQFSKMAAGEIAEKLHGMTACLVGPGMGCSDDTRTIVETVVEQEQCPIVLDADGINVLEGHIDILNRAKVPVVLTPHEGEFLQLGGDLEDGRIEGAKKLAAKTGAVVVLKGYRTVIAAPDGSVFVNSSGNPGMATGGSGDVLAGMLTCLLGQGMDPTRAAIAAVWLHGAAGDLCAKRFGRRSMLPTDMIAALSTILK